MTARILVRTVLRYPAVRTTGTCTDGTTCTTYVQDYAMRSTVRIHSSLSILYILLVVFYCTAILLR